MDELGELEEEPVHCPFCGKNTRGNYMYCDACGSLFCDCCDAPLPEDERKLCPDCRGD